MNEIIQIKCPFDGAVLSVKNSPGIETKSVTCPVCGNRYPFTQFRRVVPGAQGGGHSDETHYPGSANVPRPDDDHTHIAHPSEQKKGPVGRLKLMPMGPVYQLKEGRNVIGRKATKSSASIQIDCKGNLGMSREHIVIDVIPTAKGYQHVVALYKELVNPTFIGSEPLYFNDQFVLEPGMTINLPGAPLRFELPED